ncbi:MAG: ABC transporter ATP-binding protein [Myxococcaceae bacterium]|nr:ABC transporter ATP-binding protein [Myxococcaceae bacterium]
MPALLELDSLAVRHGATALVEGLSLELERGRVHALVGESGSGKTLSMLALLGLLPAELTSSVGKLSVEGRAVAWGTPAHAALRGRTLAMMLQDPASAMDPVMRIGRHLDEVLETVAATPGRRDALLQAVGFPEPGAVAALYPHQLSGGMRQRALLATCLAAGPKVLVADEPTTALDAALRGSVLALFRELATKQELAVVLITHDLDAAQAVADEVTVLYAGRVAEQGPASQRFVKPRHPYTAALLAARPSGGGLPIPIRGTIPAAGQWPPGCRFSPRCPRATGTCETQPPLEAGVACHHPLEASP